MKKNDRRKEKLPFTGSEKRKNIDKVHSNVKLNNRIYQIEYLTIIYIANFNVWQVIDNKKPTWERIIFEIIGINNDNKAFDFAYKYLKENE